MVGLIQKVLIDLILKVRGQEALDEIMAKAEIPNDRIFRIDTAYSDEEWNRLLSATLEVLKVDAETAYELYSEQFGSYARNIFPVWFQMSKNSYQFLTRQPQIHNNFATGISNQEERKYIEDKFKVQAIDTQNKIITHYKSKNKLCGLYKALGRCVINQYKDEATMTDVKCMNKGDDECEIHIQWQKLNS